MTKIFHSSFNPSGTVRVSPPTKLMAGKSYVTMGQLNEYFKEVDILSFESSQLDAEQYNTSADRIVKCRKPYNNIEDNTTYVFSTVDTGYYYSSIPCHPIRYNKTMDSIIEGCKQTNPDDTPRINNKELQDAENFLHSPMAHALCKAYLDKKGG